MPHVLLTRREVLAALENERANGKSARRQATAAQLPFLTGPSAIEEEIAALEARLAAGRLPAATPITSSGGKPTSPEANVTPPPTHGRPAIRSSHFISCAWRFGVSSQRLSQCMSIERTTDQYQTSLPVEGFRATVELL